MKGRFAPSPSGRMHLGNVYSALISWLSARSQGGEWLLRVEDLDRQRCHTEYAAQIEDDLLWLGLTWDEGGSKGGKNQPYFQSMRTEIYKTELEKLSSKNLLYPCFCSRADIMAASAPHDSDATVVYSGKCRYLSNSERFALLSTRKPSIRIKVADVESCFTDRHYGQQKCNLQQHCGDFIVQRADGNFAYQLAVVADDALMGVTEVVRGCDLLSSTHQQIFLYKQLGYKIPEFAHLPLILSESGTRLAKRDKSADMGNIRAQLTPEELLGLLAYSAHLIDKQQPVSLTELLQEFNWEKLPKENLLLNYW